MVPRRSWGCAPFIETGTRRATDPRRYTQAQGMTLEGAIAVSRFGLGARPGEIAAASADPRAWLAAQLNAPAEQPAGDFMTSGQLVADDRAFARNRLLQRRQTANAANQQAQNQAGNAVAAFLQPRQQIFRNEMAARFQLGFTTARPF